YGLAGGGPGQPGENRLRRADGSANGGANGDEEVLPGKASFDVQPGDVLCIGTPGGGGWGELPAGSAKN
ncbi:MAG: hydantoinase B/oxoprolinase family protein, partial [Aggregatilineales bacterium]